MCGNDAVEFCRRLTSIEKLGNREYRLPTEAEWEYACRGGTSTDHYGTAAGYQLGDVAWYRGNSGLKNQPVGLKLPNAWGLYDMHGNVWEWSLDGFQLYKQGAESTNPKGEMGLQVPRVIRGGGAGGDFASPYEECRSAHRHVRQIGDAGTNLGFRILLEVSKGDEE
ncbi:MAG: formylglycine-generating enzyme family protein [Planctomycetaceae bacterium]|nr:formylglycine-generating enzyme family protein [Planctomycetaceae bacterium]